MGANTPQITLDEAYWWLNFTCANLIRPSLRIFLNRLSDAEKAGDRLMAEHLCQQFIDNEIHTMPSPVLEQAEQLLNAIKIWNAAEIEKARQKFTECGGSYLHNPIYSYVLTMREAVERDHLAGWNSLERLVALSNKISDDLEAGELLVECGWAAYQMQNRTRAALLLEDANRRYNSRGHQIAVVFCMLGCVYWDLSQHSKALVAWRNSISRFTILSEQRLVPTEADMMWYRQVLQRLNESLEYIVEKKGQEPAGTATPSGPAARPKPAPKGAAQPDKTDTGQVVMLPTESTETPSMLEEPGITFTSDFFEAFPILVDVPAGPWKQTPGDRNVIGQVEIGQVLINSQLHYVKNLRGGGHLIRLASDGKHVVVKITGNSMNNAQPTPIEDGDYVLLRRQNTAHAGDIVVAKIYDEATRGPLTTIKRFLVDGNPLLKAESTDPQYGRLNDEFQIDGLAIAVFKPVHDSGKSDTRPS